MVVLCFAGSCCMLLYDCWVLPKGEREVEVLLRSSIYYLYYYYLVSTIYVEALLYTILTIIASLAM